MHKLRSEQDRNQPYMIARKLNSGIIVAETVAEAPLPVVHEAAVPVPILSRIRGLFRSKPAPAPTPLPLKRLYLPYGMESLLCIQRVIYLDEDDLKFCNITRIIPGENFQGSAQPTMHAEETALYTRYRVKGFEYETVLDALIRISGDGRRTRAVVEDLVPVP